MIIIKNNPKLFNYNVKKVRIKINELKYNNVIKKPSINNSIMFRRIRKVSEIKS